MAVIVMGLPIYGSVWPWPSWPANLITILSFVWIILGVVVTHISPERAKSTPARETEPKAGLGPVIQRMDVTRGHVRQFRQVFDTSAVPMLTVDNQRRILLANTCARLLLRQTLAQLHGRPLDDCLAAPRRGSLNGRWSELLERGTAAGRHDLELTDGSRMSATYQAIANILPGQHLIVLVPTGWTLDELWLADDVRYSRSRSLSPREREVLTLLADGADLTSISEELTIARTTARTHVQNVMRKLRARTRAHAVALAVRDGLITVPSGGRGEGDEGAHHATASSP